MIEKLKKAAEFLDKKIFRVDTVTGGVFIEEGPNGHIFLFRPHEKTGRHYLVEMEIKLTKLQFDRYETKMSKIWFKLELPGYFERWFKTAPSDISFKTIMEVID